MSSPTRGALVVLFVLGCSSSSDTSSSGGGCGETSATNNCDIIAEASVCGDRVTVECLDGSKPSSACEKAFTQDDQVLYCCPNAAELGDGGAATTSSTTASSTQAASTAESAASSDASTAGTTTGTGGEGGGT